MCMCMCVCAGFIAMHKKERENERKKRIVEIVIRREHLVQDGLNAVDAMGMLRIIIIIISVCYYYCV